MQVRTSNENATRETLTDNNNHTTKPGSLEDLFSGYIHVLMSRPSISWCKIVFLKRRVTCKEEGGKAPCGGSAIAKGRRILGPPRETAKGSLSLLGKGRMT